MSSRPLIAYLRPHETLSAYEMGYVSLLSDAFDLRVITVGEPAIGGAAFPFVRRLAWPDEFSWGGEYRSFLNALYARGLRRRYHIPGLARALDGVRLVQAGEAASEYSYQAARLKERFGFKLLLSASENQSIMKGRSAVARDRIHYVIDRVDHVIAVPPEARDRLVEAGLAPDRITVIGHGIDCDRFAPASCREDRPFTVGYCGRFRAEKGLELLIEAVRDLDVDLLLLGDGPDRDRLKAGASERVHFLDPLPYDAMHSFYHRIDLFVLPSVPLPGLVEQFGFVLLEAMASGVPIVATRIGGIPNVLGEAGMLIPSGDVASLRAAILSLAADHGLRRKLSESGRYRALTLYRREEIAEKMRVVYRMLLS